MPIATRTFRVFVSSTFEDLKEERDALQREVFPKLRTLCERHGARFQAIDLRWGVRNEASLDQKTMDICLREIERSQATRIKPNFIVLLGRRYGWRPLPSRIEAKEFEAVLNRIASAEDRELMDNWYWLDENAVPPERLLQPRTNKWISGNAWAALEARLLRLLLDGARGAGLQGDSLLKYQASATHREILKGVGATLEDREHVFAFCCDVPDEDCDPELIDLKRSLSARLPDTNMRTYHRGELGTLCGDVQQMLAGVIEREIARFESRSALELEVEAHDTFAREQTAMFGREDLLGRIASYLNDGTDRPLLLHGPSGCGKSAVMARASSQAKLPVTSSVVIRRFIGASPESSNGLSLLRSLCEEIGQAYGITGELPSDFSGIVPILRGRLAQSKPERPLVIFLDAPDQLAEDDPGHSLTWLSGTLPPTCRIVVSTTDVSPALTESSTIEMHALPQADAAAALDRWCTDAHRRLQPRQRDQVLSGFAECGLPLYLKLAFEEARGWRSWQTPEECELGKGVEGIIDTLLNRLSLESEHGPLLISRSLGYLAAARYGLAEEEIVDLLSADNDVWNDFLNRAHHTPPERRLPIAVWSRLFFDVQSYLTESHAPGGLVITFYHAQLRKQVAARYLAEPLGSQVHMRLARYFGAQPLFFDGSSPNRRKLSELVWQQLAAKLWAQAEGSLTDLDFIRAKCEASLEFDLVSDFSRALLREPGAGPGALVQDYRTAFSQELTRLADRSRVAPELGAQAFYLQQFRNRIFRNSEGRVDLVTQTAASESTMILHRAPNHTAAFVRRVQAEPGSDILRSFGSIRFSPDGNRLFAAFGRNNVICIDPFTGRVIATIACRGRATAIDFSADGSVMVIGGDMGARSGRGFIQTFRLDNLMPVKDREFDFPVYRLAVTASDQIVAGMSRVLRILATATLEIVNEREPYEGNIAFAVIVNRRRTLLATGEVHDEDRPARITVWDAKEFRVLTQFDGPKYGINTLAFSDDDSLLASGSMHLNSGVVAWQWMLPGSQYDSMFMMAATRDRAEQLVRTVGREEQALRGRVVSVTKSEDSVGGLCFYPKSTWVISVEGTLSRLSDAITVFNLIGDKPGNVGKIRGHPSFPIAVDVDSTARFAATLHAKSEVFVWPAHELKTTPVRAGAARLSQPSTDAHCARIAAIDDDDYGRVHLIHAPSGSEISTGVLLPSLGAAISPDGQHLIRFYWEQPPLNPYPESDKERTKEWFGRFEAEMPVWCLLEKISFETSSLHSDLLPEYRIVEYDTESSALRKWRLAPGTRSREIVFSPNGDSGAALIGRGTDPAKVFHFSMESGDSRIIEPPAGATLHSIAFSDTRNLLLIGSVAGEVRVFCLEITAAQETRMRFELDGFGKQEEVNRGPVPLGGDLWGLAKDPFRLELLACHEDGGLQRTLRPVRQLDIRYGVHAICGIGDNLLAVSDGYPSLRIYRLPELSLIAWHPLDQLCVRLLPSRDGRRLVAIGSMPDLHGLHYSVLDLNGMQPKSYRRGVADLSSAEAASLKEGLGAVANAEENYPDALRFYAEALSIRRESLGPDHADTAISEGSVGGILARMGHHHYAACFLERSLKTLTDRFGGTDPLTVKAGMEAAGQRSLVEKAMSVSSKFAVVLIIFGSTRDDNRAPDPATEDGADRISRQITDALIEIWDNSVSNGSSLAVLVIVCPGCEVAVDLARKNHIIQRYPEHLLRFLSIPFLGANASPLSLLQLLPVRQQFCDWLESHSPNVLMVKPVTVAGAKIDRRILSFVERQEHNDEAPRSFYVEVIPYDGKDGPILGLYTGGSEPHTIVLPAEACRKQNYSPQPGDKRATGVAYANLALIGGDQVTGSEEELSPIDQWSTGPLWEMATEPRQQLEVFESALSSFMMIVHAGAIVIDPDRAITEVNDPVYRQIDALLA